VVRSVPKDANEPNIVAFFAFDQSSAELLSDEQKQLLLRLSPSQFGGNRGGWALTIAIGARMLGDSVRMRAYADSALSTSESAVRENPDEPGNRIALGATLAFLGRKAEAIREGEQAVAIRGSVRGSASGPVLDLAGLAPRPSFARAVAAPSPV
jgi:hypothetical protein